VIETVTFVCSICGEPSGDICVYCTKDACANHRCERCKRCSDCCECEVPLTPPERIVVKHPLVPVNGDAPTHEAAPVVEPTGVAEPLEKPESFESADDTQSDAEQSEAQPPHPAQDSAPKPSIE
jgi:hypothetical protein